MNPKRLNKAEAAKAEMKRNERVSATKKINQSNIKILNGTL